MGSKNDDIVSMCAVSTDDLSLYKRRKLSNFERELSKLIQRADEVVSLCQSRCVVTTLQPQLLRQQMRNIRRWRNGSLPFADGDEDAFENFLQGTRISVIGGEVESLRYELDGTDANSASFDGNCSILREDMDEDIKELEEHLPLVKEPGELDSMENRIRELRQTMVYLQSELSEVCSSLSEHDSSFGETIEDRLYAFEAHPDRNRVLSVGDRIRVMIKHLKEGYHVIPEDVISNEDPELCCFNDIDVLRRQLRKMRRWQQNVVHFVADDVVDLELIIAAIESHVCTDISESSSRGIGKCRRGDSSYGTMRELRMRDVESEDAQSSTSADVTSGFSELPSSKLDVSRLTGGCGGIGSVSSLDENADFGERLI